MTTGRLRTLSMGEGPAVVILHGYAMRPETYLPLARLLAGRVRVLVPALFEMAGPWRYPAVLDALAATLDGLGLERVSLVGHSFGGGLELGFAAAWPGRVVECVFADTLGLHARFRLAGEALRHPARILGMASRSSAASFARSWAAHPDQLVAAAWWGFISDRTADIDRILAAGIPCHVMWASRDSLLARSSGEQFALRLRASFTVAAEAEVDHDWMFDDPELFAGQLSGLGLQAFGGAGPPVGPPTRRRPGGSPPPGRGSPRGGGRGGAGSRAPRERPE